MAPMVATVDETEEFVAACAKHGLDTAGVMIEVPSAALLSGPILARASFASIGTNDLTQYTMAADRLLGSLASLSTPRSEEHTSELQSRGHLVCRLLLEKKKIR